MSLPTVLTKNLEALVEDAYISGTAVTHDVSELEDCAIAVDATYYLQVLLDNSPSHEPLLPALGGMTGIQAHIEADLEAWKAHKIIPFFIFDGQTVTGQDEVAVVRGREAIKKTNEAWELYFNGQAGNAVAAFGANSGAYRTQKLYPMLQTLLKEKNLHFLVPPYNATAQIAYFDMIDSDQCAGIMGSQELLLYPIRDMVIKGIDWENGKVTAISKKQIIKNLNVNEPMFIDALLMTGTSFLPTFPPLQDAAISPRQPFTIVEAINMLRTSDKSVAATCTSFNDILQAQDPQWLDKYRKSRMVVSHFIYIAENGEVKVNDFDKLTGDNHEYLGLQLPAELFHYLNNGLIGPRMLSWITHTQIMVLPPLDGVSSEEYRRLITNQLVSVKEMTLGLLIPRLHRGIQHANITMKVWYDDKYGYTVNHRNLNPSPSQRAASWDVKEASVKQFFPKAQAGTIAFEIQALQNPEFAKLTITKERPKGIDSASMITSVAIWRFLHLRGYINDSHELTSWGSALSKAISALEPTVTKNAEVSGLNEALLVAFEMIRFDLLNAKRRHEELHGLPLSGSEEDKDSLLLLSRCAALLKLRHQANGYTGPLSKNLLAFHSLASAVREANRDLIEAIVASMFMYAQSKRDREDCWELSHGLPFINDPDVAMGIAVKTLLDDVVVDESAQARTQRKTEFPGKFVPYATHFHEDLDICFAFFDALVVGVQSLDKEMTSSDKSSWEKAADYLSLRR